MNIILLATSYFRHSNNIQEGNWNCKNLIAKTFDENKSYSEASPIHGNKEQKAMHSVVSRTWFCTQVKLNTRKINLDKIKFLQVRIANR